jgi:hypothetical protein
MVLGYAALGYVVLAFVLAGVAAAGRLYRNADDADGLDHGARVLETACAAALLALAFAVATSWALAFAGLLRRPWIVLAATPFLAAGVPQVRRAARSAVWQRTLRVPPAWWLPIAALALVGVWTAFVLWRGTIVPPYNGDALSYHMPRAAIFVQEGRFTVPQTPEGRLASWPCDYELLLADAIALVGDDGLCGWIGTASFVAFLLFATALLARWWGWRTHVLVGTVLIASTPMAIIHSGVHKNDLLECALTLGVGLFVEPWVRRGSVRALGLALVAALLALGTKLLGLVVCAALAPLVVWGAWRHRAALRLGARTVLLALAAAVSGFALLGGATYVVNLVHFHVLALPPEQKGAGYGAWEHLWMYPYLAIVGPLTPHPNWIWIPWRHTSWWMPENDIFFAGFGPAFSVMALLAPFTAVLWRRPPGDPAGRRTTSLYLLAVAALVLPVRVLPTGFILGAGRFLAFLLPVACGWVLSPILVAVERRVERPAFAAGLASALAAGAFAWFAWTCGVQDIACPWGWVAYRMDHPEDRTPHSQRFRAASALDMVAGPEDHVAADVALDSWIYQAYGPRLGRTVTYLPHTEQGPVPIPADAQWVVVDRAWNVLFGNPDFTDCSRWDLLGHGRPDAGDRKVLTQLKADPGWELVNTKAAMNQAVFRRRSSGP